MNIRNQTIYLLLIYGITGVGIIISVLACDILKMNFANIPFINLYYKIGYGFYDIWCISHIIMYVLLGFFAPNLWYISISLSILWESFEYISEKNKLSKIVICNPNDFIINTVGLIIGVIANDMWNRYKKSIDKKKEEKEKELKEESNNVKV